MPKLKIERVISFSSEDKVHTAANILLPEPSKKWKCQTEGEKSANIILQLEKACLISSIDIGNEHSAYVEVLVKRSGAPDDFKVLLVMSSFMTPLESRQSTNINKVRMFGYNDLQSPERDEKWDCIKVVCTQPFNKHIQYGLSFITLHSTDSNPTVGSAASLGKFALRPDSPNNLTIGSLFARRKEMDITSPMSAAVAIREASTSSSISSKSPKCLVPSKDKVARKKITVTENNNESPKGRNRDELLYSKDEEESHDKIDMIIRKKQQELEEKVKETKKKLKETDENASVKQQNDKNGKLTTPSSVNKRKLNESGSNTSTKKPKVKQAKPFNKLLEGVTIVISGIQNPERGDIRNRALELGARYKPDWDNTCTHLICAFTNTPKFQQVKGKGKIVNRIWIQDCHTQRKRLPWRRYALDVKDLNQNESEEEICEEVRHSPDVEILHTVSTFGDDSDTEDEIERISSLSKTPPSLSQNSFSVDTDEETFHSNIDQNCKLPELPSLLTSKLVYVDDAFSSDQRKQMLRYIIALNGIISEVPVDVDIMITTSDHVDSLKEMCSTARFVSPNWLWASYNKKQLVPTEDYEL